MLLNGAPKFLCLSKIKLNNYLVPVLLLVLQSCAQQPIEGGLAFRGDFSSKLDEVSGLVYTSDGNTFAVEDSGNTNSLYAIDSIGQIQIEYYVSNAKNRDWEDLAIDHANGTIFIGDFGNNGNDRQNLVIYRLDKHELWKDNKASAQKIKFHYPEQKKFPPKKKNRFYDAEGFLHWNGFLYIFTKDRSRPYQGLASIYRVPDTPGEYKAELVGTITTCDNPRNCSITGAAIAPNGKTLALLGAGQLWVFKNFDLATLSNSAVEVVNLKQRTQMESICFVDNTTLLIADERSGFSGGNLYSYSLK